MTVTPYEERLNANLDSALDEIGLYFEGRGSVHTALADVLRELCVNPYVRDKFLDLLAGVRETPAEE